jgi:hypothetical protein
MSASPPLSVEARARQCPNLAAFRPASDYFQTAGVEDYQNFGPGGIGSREPHVTGSSPVVTPLLPLSADSIFGPSSAPAMLSPLVLPPSSSWGLLILSCLNLVQTFIFDGPVDGCESHRFGLSFLWFEMVVCPAIRCSIYYNTHDYQANH